MSDHCKICASNDPEALIEELAERLWESRQDYLLDPTWNDASAHWRNVLRGFARTSIDLLMHHG